MTNPKFTLETEKINKIKSIASLWKTRRNSANNAQAIKVGKRFIRIFKGN